MNWMLMPLRRYAQFSGRSQRKEYWMFALFYWLLSMLASAIDAGLGFVWSGSTVHARVADGVVGSFSFHTFTDSGIVGDLLTLAFLLPWLGVSVRRLHDIGRSGWLIGAYLALLVLAVVLVLSVFISWGAPPVFGVFPPLFWIGVTSGVACCFLSLVLLVFFCLDGTRGSNRYGPDPKTQIADLAERFA